MANSQGLGPRLGMVKEGGGYPAPGPLGLLSVGFLLLLVLGWVVASALHWYNLLVVPALLLLPVAVLYPLYWVRCRASLHLDLVVRMFAGGFLPATAFILAAQLFLYALFGVLFYGGGFLTVWLRLVTPMVRPTRPCRSCTAAVELTLSSVVWWLSVCRCALVVRGASARFLWCFFVCCCVSSGL